MKRNGGNDVKNKRKLFVSIFVVFLLFFFTSEASAKVMWGKTELKQGQIGKATILTNVNAVKLSGNTLTQDKRLKGGEEYRVYTYRVIGDSGYYGLGGGLFVQKSDRVKYETPSKRKLAQLEAESATYTNVPFINNISLGMSKQQVKNVERASLIDEETNTLVYANKNVLDFSAIVTYRFENNALVEITILHDVVFYRGDLDALEAYFVVMYESLSKIYGEADVIDTNWYDDSEFYAIGAIWKENGHDVLLTSIVEFDYSSFGGIQVTIR